MAKANIDLPDGTKIVIERSVDEVAKIVSLVQGTTEPPPRKKVKPSPIKKKTKCTIKDYVRELKDEGFFKQKRALSDVKKALDTRGHIYALTSLSGQMLDLVRSKELGRIKEGRKWMYVHRD